MSVQTTPITVMPMPFVTIPLGPTTAHVILDTPEMEHGVLVK